MVTTEKTFFTMLIGFMVIVIFASISSAADQKIKAKVPGIT
jgi:hypothetical protein